MLSSATTCGYKSPGLDFISLPISPLAFIGEIRGKWKLSLPIRISRPFSAQGPGPIPVADQRRTRSPPSLSDCPPQDGREWGSSSETRFNLLPSAHLQKQSLYLSIMSKMWVYRILSKIHEGYQHYCPRNSAKPSVGISQSHSSCIR